MSTYRIIHIPDDNVVLAQVWRWWCPVWWTLGGYSTLYGNDLAKCASWCQERIDEHSGKTPKPPTFQVIDSKGGLVR